MNNIMVAETTLEAYGSTTPNRYHRSCIVLCCPLPQDCILCPSYAKGRGAWPVHAAVVWRERGEEALGVLIAMHKVLGKRRLQEGRQP